MNRTTKILIACGLCTLAGVAFAGQENKTPMGKDGKQGYGQQQEQQQEQQEAKAQAEQQQAEEEAREAQRQGNEQPE